TQTLDDAGVPGSIGTVGDAYDNAVAESFVDSFKTSSSRTAPGHHARSSSSPSWSTSRGSTTSASTNPSTTGHHAKSRNSTL
ncbi:MAG TPA: hypothetical protein VKG38_02570, partial [Solirubrobacteraceae bacterium]|nr:hypothetical protein [Solirubrobacteraceae bacterium]